MQKPGRLVYEYHDDLYDFLYPEYVHTHTLLYTYTMCLHTHHVLFLSCYFTSLFDFRATFTNICIIASIIDTLDFDVNLNIFKYDANVFNLVHKIAFKFLIYTYNMNEQVIFLMVADVHRGSHGASGVEHTKGCNCWSPWC